MTIVEASGLALPARLQPTALTLEAGTLTGIVGPNGSGKTSLLHALARIGRAAGTVTVDGETVERLGPAQRSRALAFLPTSRDLPWPVSVEGLIALSGASREQVGDAIDRLELASFAQRRADRLSTGERSRALLARALATRPRLLLLDEPTANLDPLWQMRLMELLRAEVAERRSAALIAMHDLDLADRYADRLIVMDGGRIAADGLPRDILASRAIPQVFGIERGPEGWRPALTPPAGR